MTSDKKNVSLLADIFIKKGLSDIIISPGSRNAPIVIAFAGQDRARMLRIVDERSAGFFALGMALQTGKPVAIACTSGTAPLNYAPAIAEAYYQKVPLIVLTADRPPELIDHGDGQTIRQKGVYANYIKASFELPVVIDDPATFGIAETAINKAIDSALYPEPGPVHINIPFREPLYGTTGEMVSGRIINTLEEPGKPNDEMLNELASSWNETKRIMLIAGQMQPDKRLNDRLAALAKLDNVVVLTETTSNLHDPRFMDTIDNLVAGIGEQEADKFKPDLVVSFGGQLVSKMVKKYLRLHPPQKHWHISPSGEEMDTYFSLSKTINTKPADFFAVMSKKIGHSSSDYATLWADRYRLVNKRRQQYLDKIGFSDLRVFSLLMDHIPKDSVLHLGNSTPVRYAQLFGSNPGFTCQSNRGVSGIDGQVSTAAGAAVYSDKINTLITGDLGFFYDSNALMNHHLVPNLKIIMINNGGGGIFRYIPGPDQSPYLEEFFEAKHDWKAEKIAEAFGVHYFSANNEKSLLDTLPLFYNIKLTRPALLEIFTPAEENARVLKEYFKFLKKT